MFAELCRLMARGASMSEAANEVGTPKESVWEYISQATDGEMHLYARAIANRALVYADRIDDVVQHVAQTAEAVGTGAADSETAHAVFNAGKLAVDAYKWVSSRLVPKLYGDVQQVNVSVSSHEMHLKALQGFADRGRKKLTAIDVPVSLPSPAAFAVPTVPVFVAPEDRRSTELQTVSNNNPAPLGDTMKEVRASGKKRYHRSLKEQKAHGDRKSAKKTKLGGLMERKT